MGMTPAYYLADFMTGQMLGPVLPLESVSLSSSFQPGQFSAQLDMRKATDSFAEAKNLLDMFRAGKCTLVPVLEGLSNGHAAPLQSRALGEWWISDVTATHSDPVVTLSGPEFAGYFKHLLVTQTWKGSFSAWALVRDMMREATRTDQAISFTTGSGSGGPTVDVEIEKSKVDYWSAIESARDGDENGFEWRVGLTLNQDGIAPYSVTRTLQLGAPDLRFHQLGITLEIVTPGSPPASALDMTRTRSETAAASTIYGFGVGAGVDQVTAWTSRSRVPGEPGKSKMITVQDAKYPALKRATSRALTKATPEDRVFSVHMPTDRYIPSPGAVWSWIQEPSWSMPERVEGTVRVLGWSWSSPSPGAQDVYTLDLVEV